MPLTLELTSIVLSLVALIVTVLGFLASLKFFRYGVEGQCQAERILAKVEAKVDSVSSQVGSLFATTLNAALNRPGEQVQAQPREAAPTGDPDSPINLFAREAREGQGVTSSLLKLFTLRSLRFSNVSDDLGRGFFEIGVDQGFNLFDGQNKVLYYGHFYQLEPREIVARVRILVGRLRDISEKVSRAPQDPKRDLFLSLLQGTTVAVLIPRGQSGERILDRVADFQPLTGGVPVTAWTPEDVEEELRREYEAMEP